MYITCSKKSNILQKRVGKYLSKYLPDIEYIPRGKTNLLKLFRSATYLGHSNFLLISGNNKQIKLTVYNYNKNKSFIPQTEYLLNILDLRHILPFKDIENNNQEINDSNKIFYFLKKNFFSKRSDYGIFLLEQNPTYNIFEFRLKEKYLGFKFKIVNVKRYD
jgi:hypothetical protein